MSYTAEKYPAYDGSTAIAGKKFCISPLLVVGST